MAEAAASAFGASIWSSNWRVNCYGSSSIRTAWQGTFKSTRRINIRTSNIFLIFLLIG